MKLLKIILCISISISLTGVVFASDHGSLSPNLEVKTPYPNDDNGDVFRRMQSSGFDFSKPHDVEFYAVFRTESMADSVAMQYVADSKAGDKMKSINTKPAQRGGMELQLVKTMYVTYENVTNFERKLANRVARHDGYLDGWGVLQE